MAALRLADDIGAVSTPAKTVDVLISYDVVKLFSEQLYASPVKAIEELVVNSWDAEASACSVLVDLDGERPLIAVYDNGKGMTLDELENLWHIGVSQKLGVTSKRKQIGKFGIGKLASYAVARRATYISRTASGTHAVSINFDAFADATNSETGISTPVTLTLRSISDLRQLEHSAAFAAASRVFQTQPQRQDPFATPTWTLVVLEDLKEKAHQLATRRLRWVLSTAMPFQRDFSLFLNGENVESSKEKLERVVSFSVRDLEDERLHDLGAVTGEPWTKSADGVVSPSFPQGVTGEVYVTRASLYAAGGKSEDLGRSHGFFVRVHNRLINESDPLLGARPLSFTTWYRFAAVVEVPDLNQYVTASRDDVEQSEVKAKLRELLIQLFNQARDQYYTIEKKKEEENKRKKEGVRDYVSTELVERPLADALVAEAANWDRSGRPVGAVWRLLEPVVKDEDLQELVRQLYTTERSQRRYTFRYSPGGALNPIVRLDPRTASLTINEDHELVREFGQKDDSKRLLEAIVVGEALLEVYLYAARVPTETVADLLDRRDVLLRSLALDESFSLRALAQALRDATHDASDLEVALVGALRALGFGARHIGGSGTPDGLAEYVMHGIEEKSFTLEAKSSADVPSLPQLDFAGLRAHYEGVKAAGCLLVAPAYPGADDPESQVSQRAAQQKVSCWTVDQLASVVDAAERRHINARKLQKIVLESFTPIEVTRAVEGLLSEPSFDNEGLYQAVIRALQELQPRLRSTPRTIDHLATIISGYQGFAEVDTPDVRGAVLDLSRASSGMLHLTEDDGVFVLGSLDELSRRVAHLANIAAPARRRGTFKGVEA